MSKKVQETFTKIFIDRIEERRANGENVTAPWRKLWNPAMGMDRNLDTGKAYRGGNVFMTACQGYASPFWTTRKQAAKLGGEINRQEDGKLVPYTPVLFWNFPDAEQKAAGRFPFCKFYQVWNVDQTTGLEELAASKLEKDAGPPVNPIEAAQAIVDGWKGCPPIAYGNARAYYTPGTDRITMPDMQAFASAEAFYSTLFHEMAHSTGHRTRLDRDGVANPVRFASHDYSEEELVAEMSAGMLTGHAGIDTDETLDNSAAYLDHWLAKLKREPGWLAAAGGQAQKAVDLIRGIKWEKAAK
jgi:antirestriction protein ArdC